MTPTLLYVDPSSVIWLCIFSVEYITVIVAHYKMIWLVNLITKSILYGSRAHVKAARCAVSLANILLTDYFQIYAFVHYKGLC